MSETTTSERQTLSRVLSPKQVWALALGSIIGWGCFILPGDSFLPGSGPLGTVLGMFIGALMLCSVVYIYGDMIVHAPVAGGEYAHSYLGFGPNAAFITGWTLTLGYICIIGANVSALSLFVRYMLPGVFDFGLLYEVVGWKIYTGEVLLMIFATLFFGYINYRGISIAGTFQMILAFILSLGVILFAVGAFAVETASFQNLNPLFSETRSPFASIIAIVAIAPWAFVGFDTVSQSAEEFKFSATKAKRIMLASVIWGAFLYSIVTIGVGIVIPYPEMLAMMEAEKQAGGVGWATGVACEMAYGKFGSIILGLSMLAAVCTGIMGFYVATTRLLFSMGRGAILPPWFAEIHPKYHTPYKAILFTIAIVLIVPWCGRAMLLWAVDMSSVGIGVAYLFTCLTGFKVIRHSDFKNKNTRLVIALIGAAVSVLCIFLLLFPGSPAFLSYQARIALVLWILLGVGFYFVSRRHWLSDPDKIREQILGNSKVEMLYRHG